MLRRSILLLIEIGFILLLSLHLGKGFKQDEDNREAPRLTEQPVDTIVAKHLPATLNCRATGVPTPVIRWFKDGLPIRLGGPHRVQLPTGELFFLRVSHGRQHSDAGVYSCEASNLHGTVKSRVATLQVAVLREEFRLEPVSTRAAQGDTILLECAPPRGTPEPKVTWKKNGDPFQIDGSTRLRIVDGGNLVIQNVKQSDEGTYQCVASNTAGTRESAPAQLNVHIKPYIIVGPQDTVAVTGNSVKFQCQVGGDPLPDVLWRRSAGGGNMPLGRVHILEDRSLRLDAVTTADSGFYTCEADNAIGGVYASGHLEVHSLPNFTTRPIDRTIEPGTKAIFDCCAIGNPIPTLFWSIEDEKFILFPGSTLNKYSALKNGNGKSSLYIENATIDNNDATIICSAVNQAGAAISKAKLFISSSDMKLPPIIEIGPTNQTVPYHATVRFPCNASGTPTPIISWYHNGSGVVPNSKIKIDNERLILSDVGLNNNGVYSCVASSVNGKYVWSATLTIESDIYSANANPKQFTVPDKPNRPELSRLSHNEITISWSLKETNTTFIHYRIEMFSKIGHDLQWLIVGSKIKDTMFTYHVPYITNTYWFFLRAENQNGFSLPSDVSDEINIKIGPGNYSVTESEEIINIRDDSILELTNAIALDSNSIKLTWKILQYNKIHGFYIYFGPRGNTNTSEWNNLEISLLTSININSFVIRDLKKYTNYEMFLVPFYENNIRRPSNSRYVSTAEDAPDHPPMNIEAILFNSTSVRLEWLSPPDDKKNGVITHYELRVFSIDKTFNQTILVTNVTSKTDSSTYFLTNLTAGVLYSVKVAAATKAGLGPFSAPAMLKLNSPAIESNTKYPLDKLLKPVESEDLLSETWFLTLIFSMVTILAMLFALIFAMKYRHVLSKSSTVPQIYEHTAYGANLVTHMKSAEPLDNTFCRNVVKPNTLLWNGLDNHSKGEYTYKSDEPPNYEPQNQSVADYAEVDSSVIGFRIHNVCNKIPSPAAYASVLIVDNNLQGSRCWIQNKSNSKSNSKTALDEEEIYPAYNGGYYNRNVYYDNYYKSNSVVNGSNDFHKGVGMQQNLYSGDDELKQESSGHASNDGSCLLPAFSIKPITNSSLSIGRNDKLSTFVNNHLIDDSLNTYQEINTPERLSSESSSINNSSSENGEPYFTGSIQPMKLLNHSNKKLSFKSNANTLGTFAMNKPPYLKTEYHSSTKSEPGQ